MNCTDRKLCIRQGDFRRSNAGKFKIKYDGGQGCCYFCERNLSYQLLGEGIDLNKKVVREWSTKSFS